MTSFISQNETQQRIKLITSDMRMVYDDLASLAGDFLKETKSHDSYLQHSEVVTAVMHTVEQAAGLMARLEVTNDN